MTNEHWYRNYTAELEQAVAARQAGNEGMARVCARRAVGWLLVKYFYMHGIQYSNPSAFDRINYFIQLDNIPSEARETAKLFILRITPEHQLPVDADLIEEARNLRTTLFVWRSC